MEEDRDFYDKYIKQEDSKLPYPLFSFPEKVRTQAEELSPLRSLEELEDEFSEWICKIGLPGSENQLIKKFLFFCRMKGEAKNL